MIASPVVFLFAPYTSARAGELQRKTRKTRKTRE